MYLLCNQVGHISTSTCWFDPYLCSTKFVIDNSLLQNCINFLQCGSIGINGVEHLQIIQIHTLLQMLKNRWKARISTCWKHCQISVMCSSWRSWIASNHLQILSSSSEICMMFSPVQRATSLHLKRSRNVSMHWIEVQHTISLICWKLVIFLANSSPKGVCKGVTNKLL